MTNVRKSDPGSANLRCIWSAASLTSAGRSRGSWIESAAVMISTSRTQPLRPDSRIIRASRGSTGSSASLRPVGVSRGEPPLPPVPGAIALSSSSSRTPSATFLASGGSTNGKSAIAPRSSAAIRRMTEARLVRRISGSVNSGRARKSSSV